MPWRFKRDITSGEPQVLNYRANHTLYAQTMAASVGRVSRRRSVPFSMCHCRVP